MMSLLAPEIKTCVRVLSLLVTSALSSSFPALTPPPFCYLCSTSYTSSWRKRSRHHSYPPASTHFSDTKI